MNMPSRKAPAEVEFSAVSKRYGAVTAVDAISFRIEPGTLVTLLGPSGCGKTTTLRMIAGLELASEGRIVIGGKDVTRLPATDRDVTMVFQSYALFPHLSVAENVAYGLNVSGMKKKEAQHLAERTLSLVGLEGYGARLPSELSGGQQQRVALARALVLEPSVLLFDEPLSNLDARLRRRMREEIRELQQRLGVTAVYVTHDRDEALSVSDKIIVMDRARIVQEGTPREVYEAPRSGFIARFLGEANLVSGTVRNGAVELGEGLKITARGHLSEGTVEVAIRPESIRLARDAAGAATVKRATYLGSHMEYTLETPIGELFAIGPAGGTAFAVGEKIFVEFAEEGVAIIPVGR